MDADAIKLLTPLTPQKSEPGHNVMIPVKILQRAYNMSWVHSAVGVETFHYTGPNLILRLHESGSHWRVGPK